MPALKSYTLAAAAAASVLAATAIASWHRTDAEVPDANVQIQRSHQRPAAMNTQSAYLPSLFVEEERSAPIEPMPPQF